MTGMSNYERRIFEDLAARHQSIRQLLILYDDLLTENRRLFAEREAYKAVAEERVSTWTPPPINSQPQ